MTEEKRNKKRVIRKMDEEKKIKWEKLKESIINTMLDREIEYLKYSENIYLIDENDEIEEKIKNTSQKEWEERAREQIESKIARSIRENTFEELMQEVRDIQMEKREKVKKKMEKIASEKKVTVCVECGKPGDYKYFHGFKKYDRGGNEIKNWDESDLNENVEFCLCKKHAEKFDANDGDSLYRDHLLDRLTGF